MYCIGNSGIYNYPTSDLILSVIKMILVECWQYFVPLLTLPNRKISYEMDRPIKEGICNNDGISHQGGNGVK